MTSSSKLCAVILSALFVVVLTSCSPKTESQKHDNTGGHNPLERAPIGKRVPIDDDDDDTLYSDLDPIDFDDDDLGYIDDNSLYTNEFDPLVVDDDDLEYDDDDTLYTDDLDPLATDDDLPYPKSVSDYRDRIKWLEDNIKGWDSYIDGCLKEAAFARKRGLDISAFDWEMEAQKAEAQKQIAIERLNRLQNGN